MAEYRPRPPRRGNRSGRREQPDRLGAGLEQHARARPAVAPVVSTSSTSRTRPGAALGREHPAHRLAPGGRAAAGLRTRVAETTEQRHGRYADPGRDRPRERPRLVVPARGEPLSGQRHPRDGARRPRHIGPRLGHRAPERIGDGAPSPELQPVDRTTDRSVEPERRAGDRDRVGRTVPARRLGRAAGAPHRSHHGGDSTTSSERHLAQNGHGPEPQPAHRLGNSASSSGASTRGRYPAPADTTRRPTAGGCRPRPPNPCRDP